MEWIICNRNVSAWSIKSITTEVLTNMKTSEHKYDSCAWRVKQSFVLLNVLLWETSLCDWHTHTQIWMFASVDTFTPNLHNFLHHFLKLLYPKTLNWFEADTIFPLTKAHLSGGVHFSVNTNWLPTVQREEGLCFCLKCVCKCNLLHS